MVDPCLVQEGYGKKKVGDQANYSDISDDNFVEEGNLVCSQNGQGY